MNADTPEYETAWSPATGWTNGKGRYLAVTKDPERPTVEELSAECRLVSPPADGHGRPKDDIAGSMRDRVRNQLSVNWISANRLAQRLGVSHRDRVTYQGVMNALRFLWLGGEAERKSFPVSLGSDTQHFLYRRKESR